MTRCIQCTRCVRFMTEVAGVEELGAIGRGEDMEITTYLERGMMSELSANVVDLCPVGALTHRPWAFAARPWELRKTESIDVMDAVGSAIRVDTRGREVVRILPRNNDAVNEEWISDKTRHVADGLRTQRLDRPYIRKNGRLEPAGWDEALALVAAEAEVGARPERIAAIAGDLAGAEEMFALKDLLGRLGVAQHRMPAGRRQARSRASGARSYLFNSTIEGIEQADAILLVGTNPRLEAAVLNARIRKRWRQGGLSVGADRREGRSDLPVRVSGRRTADAERGDRRQAQLRRRSARRQAADGDRRRRPALARPDGAAVLAAAARSRCRPGTARTRAGTRSTCCTRQLRASLGSIVGFVPGERGLDVARHADGGQPQRRRRASTCWAPTRSTCRRWARPSSSIRAATAMPARSAPT